MKKFIIYLLFLLKLLFKNIINYKFLFFNYFFCWVQQLYLTITIRQCQLILIYSGVPMFTTYMAKKFFTLPLGPKYD